MVTKAEDTRPDFEEMVLDLSTQVEPTKPFTVDGDRYEILSLAHIGKDKEARLLALYRRMERLSKRYEESRNDQEAEKAAGGLQQTRIEIITSFTTLSTDVAEKLPLPGQIQLLTSISNEMGLEAEAAEEDE